jgi:hypothetical protein
VSKHTHSLSHNHPHEAIFQLIASSAAHSLSLFSHCFSGFELSPRRPLASFGFHEWCSCGFGWCVSLFCFRLLRFFSIHLLFRYYRWQWICISLGSCHHWFLVLLLSLILSFSLSFSLILQIFSSTEISLIQGVLLVVLVTCACGFFVV